MWAVDHYPIEPDVITSAKALRVGATVSRSDMFPTETSRLSSTWGAGDIVASMRARSRSRHRGLRPARQRRRAGPYFMDRLREISAGRSLVEDVRGLGLMTALEFDTADRRDAVMETALRTASSRSVVAELSPTPPATRRYRARTGTLSRHPRFGVYRGCRPCRVRLTLAISAVTEMLKYD